MGISPKRVGRYYTNLFSGTLGSISRPAVPSGLSWQAMMELLSAAEP